jgi:hypothetical protein
MSDGDSGGRSLGSDSSEPLPSSWARPSVAPRPGRVSNTGSGRFATLRDIGSSAPPAGGGGSSGSDDHNGDDEGTEGESWFAGGERR